MTNRFTCLILAIFTLVVLYEGCSSSLSHEQLRFGIEAAKRDLWDEAIFRWKKNLQFSPNSAAAHNNLAVAYEKKGLWEDAKKEYEIAVKLSPKDKYIISNQKQFMRRYEAKQDEVPQKK